MTNQSIIKLIKLQKIKVDITKETAGYYKTFIIIIIIVSTWITVCQNRVTYLVYVGTYSTLVTVYYHTSTQTME